MYQHTVSHGYIRSIFLFTTILLLSVIAGSHRVHAATEDFSAYTLGEIVGQGSWTGDEHSINTFAVSDDDSFSAPQSLQLSTNLYNYYIGRAGFDAVTAGTFSYRFKVVSRFGSASSYLVVDPTDHLNSVKLNFGLANSGTSSIRIRRNYNDVTLIDNVSIGEWHHIEANFWCGESDFFEYKLRLDGGVWTATTTDNRSCATLDKVFLAGSIEGVAPNIFVDDITLTASTVAAGEVLAQQLDRSLAADYTTTPWFNSGVFMRQTFHGVSGTLSQIEVYCDPAGVSGNVQLHLHEAAADFPETHTWSGGGFDTAVRSAVSVLPVEAGPLTFTIPSITLDPAKYYYFGIQNYDILTNYNANARCYGAADDVAFADGHILDLQSPHDNVRDWYFRLLGEHATTTPQSTSMLSFSPDLPEGISQKKGTADKDIFTFKTIYTGSSTPAYVRTVIETTALNMIPDATASAELRDGNYANGEQYIATSTFAKGSYSFSFEASDGTTVTTLGAENPIAFSTGYDSVVFIPGIQASRLYSNDGTQLWEPASNAHAAALAMDQYGNSVNNVYTQDILDEGNVLPLVHPNIYKSFMEQMDSLVSNETIAAWQSLPYDWRYGLDVIATDDIQLATTTYAMMATIEQMASSSDSGKVTLIGHSMGGLVGKVLIDELVKKEEADLVGTFIMVATPQLGTPKAVASLLHGLGQSLPEQGGFLLNDATARAIGSNMQSAYTLLPGDAYFAHVRDTREDGQVLPYTSAVEFDASIANLAGHDPLFVPSQFVSAYGSNITTASELNAFLLGSEGRGTPQDDDTVHPTKLNPIIFASSTSMRTRLDAWVAPQDLRVVQIAGWGFGNTLRGIRYRTEDQRCVLAEYLCYHVEPYLDIEPLFTSDGDGTVVTPSAVAMGTTTIGTIETWYVDLPSYNEELLFGVRNNRKHGDILEIQSVRSLIEKDVTSQSKDNIEHIFPAQPTTAESCYRLSLHSPLSIDLFSQDRLHTGRATTSGGLVVNEQIPNSYYMEFGEGKYVGVPASFAPHIEMHGQAQGTFTLILEEFQGNTVVASTTFADIPSSTSTVVTMSLPAEGGLAAASSLSVDLNGDGVTDFSLAPVLNGVVTLSQIPPHTSVSATGTLGLGGWYIAPVDITLTATDTDNDVASINYSLNGTEWNTYGAPVTITSDGTTTLLYFAVDTTGNREATSSFSVLIDTTAPSTALNFSAVATSSIALSWSGSDEVSGIDSFELARDGTVIVSTTTTTYTDTGLSTSTTYTYILTVYDIAGNSTTSSVSTTTLGVTTPPSGLSAGLVGHWTFDEGSGSVAHDAALSHDGTLYNSPTWTTGRIGGALSFDGTNDYVLVGDPTDGSLDFGTSSFSYSLWVYVASSKDEWDTPLWKGGQSSAVPGYVLELGYDDWDNTVADGTRAPGVYLGDEINGQWVMLTIVVDRATNTMYGYKNGVRVQDTDSVTNLGSVSNDKPLTFGAQRLTPSDFFKGKLDDVRIYNRALSAAEVAQLYGL